MHRELGQISTSQRISGAKEVVDVSISNIQNILGWRDAIQRGGQSIQKLSRRFKIVYIEQTRYGMHQKRLIHDMDTSNSGQLHAFRYSLHTFFV